MNIEFGLFVEEKDIMQSSLEMENKNLTDNILQLESEKESLLGENESLKKESEDLASRCHQWKHSYDELMLQNTNTGKIKISDSDYFYRIFYRID